MVGRNTAALRSLASIWRQARRLNRTDDVHDKGRRGGNTASDGLLVAIHFQATEVMEHIVNCTTATRMDYADAHMCPRAMRPSDPGDAGPDNSLEPQDPCLAIICETSHHWKSRCGVLESDGQPWPAELTGLDVTGRVILGSEIDALVGAWGAERTPAEAEAALQAAGILARANQNRLGDFSDPQLNHRGHWMETDHRIHDRMVVEAPRPQIRAEPHERT